MTRRRNWFERDAEPVDPPKLASYPATGLRPPGKVPATPEMFRARLVLFRDLIAAGMPRHLVARAVEGRTTPAPEDGPAERAAKIELATRIGAPLTERQAQATYDKARKEIADAFETDKTTARAAQAIRLEQDLLGIRSDVEQSRSSRSSAAGLVSRDRLYHAISRHEELLSKVLGTQAAQKIEIDATIEARRSLVAVVMNLTPEEEERAIREQEEIERLEPARE